MIVATIGVNKYKLNKLNRRVLMNYFMIWRKWYVVYRSLSQTDRMQ